MQCQETQRFHGRTSADIVCGVLDLLSQSKRSAALKAHCCHAHAQHESAALRRWHPLSERMRDAAQGRPALRPGGIKDTSSDTVIAYKLVKLDLQNPPDTGTTREETSDGTP